MVKILDFSVRANPLGTPEAIKTALTAAIREQCAAPVDPDFTALRQTIALRHGVQSGQIAVSQREEELIALLAASAGGARRALLPVPCPRSYERVLKRCGLDVKSFALPLKHNYRIPRGALAEALDGCDLLILGNPAFPSAALMPPAELLSELDRWLAGGGWLILDERAVDFTYGSITNSLWSGLRREPRAALIRSFTDSLALALCPLCYAVGGENWIAALRARQFAPALSPLAHYLAPALEHIMPFRSSTVDAVTRLMPRLIGRLRRISGLRPLPSDANWVLCRLERDDITAPELAAQLRRRFIIVPPCIDERHFTLGLRVPIETDRFIKAAREILMPKTKA